ncbi:MAG: YtxH domain-containing protein [Anaerolineae bacterium]|nr:YtxH domain-containing protein [Anaerolineae bacterium]
MEDTTSFVIGFLFGAVVGAAAAALMAPQEGTALRAQIRQRLEAMAEEGRRAAAERRAELEAQFAQARQFRPSTTGATG